MKRYLILLSLLTLMLPLVAGVYTIGEGTLTQQYIPVYGWYDYSWSKIIYTAAEMSNAGLTAMQMDGVGFNVSNTPVNYTKNPIKVFIRHTTANTIDNTYPNNAEFQEVFNGSYTWNGSGWHYFVFDNPFFWDGTSNIELLFENWDGSYTGSYPQQYSHSTSTNLAVYNYQDSSFPTSSGTTTTTRPNIQIVTPMVAPPGSTTLVQPPSGATMLPTSVNLMWNATLGADGYKLYFGSSPTPPLVADLGATTSYNATNLQNETTYYWQIVPYNTYGDANNCPVWNFTTIAAGLIQIGTGTASTYRPFSTLYGYERSAALYTQDQIGTYGMVTSLAWSVGSAGTANTPYKIWMKSIPENALTYETWDNMIDGATLVKEGNHSFNSTGWHTFILDVPFIYATGNLLIGVQSDSGGSGSGGYPYIHYTSGNTNKHQTWYQDNSPSTSTGNLLATLPNIMMQLTEPTGDPGFAINPSIYNFGDVRVGSTKSQNFTITNIGGGDLIVNSITVSGNPDFTLSNLPNLPATMATIENTSFTVNFAPSAIGLASATITITDNIGGRSTHTVQVLGNGTEFLIIGDGSSNQYMPVNAYYGYTYSQSIYLQSEISTPEQRIEKIAYYWNGAGVGNYSNEWVVYMGHTDDSVFASTTGWIPLSQLTPVYAGTLNIPAVAGWIEIELHTPFVYNNSQNLVIAVDENRSSYDGSSQFFYCTPTGNQNRSLRYYNDSTNPDPASPPVGTLVSAYPNIKMFFGELPTNPIFSYNPESLDFEYVIHAVASEAKSVTVQNNGGGVLSLSAGNIALSGPNADEFSFDTGNLPADLGPGQSVEIPVTVTPISEGAISATLRMMYDGVNYDVALSAVGLPEGVAIIGNGNTTGTHLPINTLYGYSYSQSIYLQNEINTQDQRIEKIAYYWDAAGIGLNNDQWTIYMGHTDNTGFTSTTSWIPESGLTQVFSGTVSFPETAGWMEILLTQPFVYNNAQNLVIATLETSPSYTYGGWFFNTVAANRSIRYQSDSILPNPASPPTGTLQGHHPNIMMFFGDLPTEPVFTYAPSSINFGSVMNATTSIPQNVTVTNTGAGVLNLSLTDLSLVGINANEFSFGTENLPMALSPGQSATIPITVTAATEGAISATLRMVYDGVNYDVALSATGLPAGLIIIGDGTVTTRYPLGSFYGYERSASLYTAAEMGGGNNRISALGWYANQAASDIVPTKIYLKNYPALAVAADTWANFIQDATLVFDATVNGVQANDWNIYTLNNTFDLDSGENLLVLVERNHGGNGGSAGSVAPAIRGTTLANMHHMTQADNSPPTGTTSAQTSRPNIMILASSYDVTSPPNPAVLVSPEDGANMVLQTPTLVWTSGGGAPSGYKLYLGTSNPPEFVEDLGDVNTYIPDTALAGETTYYWQIVPYNTIGDATGCPIWSFTTLPDGLIIIGDGTATQRYPFGTVWGYERSAALYLANEVGEDGFITDLNWYCQSTTNTNVPYRIYMGTTDAAAFTAVTWADFSEDLSLVKEGTHVFNTSEWHSFVLDNPYLYEGGNLIIAVETFYGGSGGGSGHSFRYTTSASNSHQYWYGDNTPPTTYGTLNTYRPNIMMLKGPVPQGPPAPPIMTAPLSNATGLPVAGFNLVWRPDLNNGGMPDYYAIYISHEEDTIFDEYYFETENAFFNPVVEGDMEFGFLETWYWIVHAFNDDGDELAERAFSFTTEADPRVNLPYSQDFGSDGSFPANWTQTVSGVPADRWTASNSDEAGGDPYEMMCSWVSGIGTSRLISTPLNTEGISNIMVNFKHRLSSFNTGCTGKVQYSHNLTDWFDTGFEFETDIDIPATEVNIGISHLNAATTYIAWVMDGNHYNFNFWYVDDVEILEWEMLDTPELTMSIEDDLMTLSWEPVAGAEWYLLYIAFDPYGEYFPFEVIPGNMNNIQIYLDYDSPDMAFAKLTAGNGDEPDVIEFTSPLRVNKKQQERALKKK